MWIIKYVCIMWNNDYCLLFNEMYLVVCFNGLWDWWVIGKLFKIFCVVLICLYFKNEDGNFYFYWK